MISVNDEKELRGFEVQTNLSGDDIEKLLSDTKRLHTEFIHNNQHVSIAGERSTDGKLHNLLSRLILLTVMTICNICIKDINARTLAVLWSLVFSLVSRPIKRLSCRC